MPRRPVAPNPALDALVEDRIDLKVQINLLMDADRRDEQKLTDLNDQLRELDQRIARQRKPMP